MLGENTLEKPSPALQNIIISLNIFLFFFVAINNCALGIRWRTGGRFRVAHLFPRLDFQSSKMLFFRRNTKI